MPPAKGPFVGLIPVTIGAATYLNSSAGNVADVPSAVTTVTSNVPVPAGLVATTWVSELTVKLLAASTPKSTAVAPVKPVPVIVTDVPPAKGPFVGLIPVTAGAATYLNWSADDGANAPSAVTTVTSTVPVPTGLVATIWVSELTVKLLAASAPKSTAVAPVKPVPVIVTDVPPAKGPFVGLIPVTAGAATYLNWSADDVADASSAVTTVTSTVPVPTGLVATIWVSELTVKLLAASTQNPRRSRP